MGTINKQLGTFKYHPTDTITYAAVECEGVNYLVSYADARPDELSALPSDGIEDEDHQVKDGETIEQALNRCDSKIDAARKCEDDGYRRQE